MQRGCRILIDSNAIIEAHRLDCWSPLSSCFRIETVSMCVKECERGNQQRRNYVPVDVDSLKQTSAVRHVDDNMRAKLVIAEPEAADLDPSEKDLVAYAMTQANDIYLLCSPDKACMKIAAKTGLLDQLVSLEAMSRAAGLRSMDFRRNYTDRWHCATKTQLRLELL